MTLVLTCLTQAFAIQSSDRRLTNPTTGELFEDERNKATVWGNGLTFGYTGLAKLDGRHTDEWLLWHLNEKAPGLEVIQSMERGAGRAVRSIPFSRDVTTDERCRIKRTAFVATGFLGLARPHVHGLVRNGDGLYPVIMTMSNFFSETQEWLPLASQKFSHHLMFLHAEERFRIASAGCDLSPRLRRDLERSVRRCLDHGVGAFPIARLLARCVQDAAKRNDRIGPNVMTVIIPRSTCLDKLNYTGTTTISRGPIDELARFRTQRQDEGAKHFVYLPGDERAFPYYGPNIVSGGVASRALQITADETAEGTTVTVSAEARPMARA